LRSCWSQIFALLAPLCVASKTVFANAKSTIDTSNSSNTGLLFLKSKDAGHIGHQTQNEAAKKEKEKKQYTQHRKHKRWTTPPAPRKGEKVVNQVPRELFLKRHPPCYSHRQVHQKSFRWQMNNKKKPSHLIDSALSYNRDINFKCIKHIQNTYSIESKRSGFKLY
jgi:hypothetical protein